MAFMLKVEREGIVGAIPPPPGVTPNFVNPESEAHQVIIAIAIMFPLATLVLFLRVYTRAMIVRNMGPDDYAIIMAWILLIPNGITVAVLIKLGLGVHLWNIPLTTFSPHFLKIGVINGVFYGMSFMCVKLSILLLYLRLSPYRSFRIAVWLLLIVVVIYSTLGSFEFVFNCRPIAKNWDITIAGGSCIDVGKILLTHGSLNILTDIAMLILPVTLVWKLKMPMKQRVALAGLFMTGTLVCVISSIRLKTVVEIIRSPDFTGGPGTANEVWSVYEMCFGIICACLPTFKPFLRRHFPKVLGSSYQSNAFTQEFSRRTANTAPNTLTGEYELESREQRGKSGMARMSKQQTGIDNESQEDILGDGHPKNKSAKREVIITLDARPLSQNDSSW